MIREPQKIPSSKRFVHLEEKKKDDLTMAMIRTLNELIQQAKKADLGNAAIILKSAKEDLVYWAAYLNFAETPQEKFINEHLLNG